MSLYFGGLMWSWGYIQSLWLVLFGIVVCFGGISLSVLISKIYDKREAEEDKKTYIHRVELELSHNHKKWKSGQKYIYDPVNASIGRNGCFDYLKIFSKKWAWLGHYEFECPIVIIKCVKITLIGSDENIYDNLLQEHRDHITKYQEHFEKECTDASFFQKYYQENEFIMKTFK